MSKQQTSPELEQGELTQHAMLVAWGLYAEQLGLIAKMEGVKLKQKTRRHRPQTKVLEFLVAMLAGLPHMQDISRSAHPLDQDRVVAKAWGQPAWADYSGVSRTLQSCQHRARMFANHRVKKSPDHRLEMSGEIGVQHGWEWYVCQRKTDLLG